MEKEFAEEFGFVMTTFDKESDFENNQDIDRLDHKPLVKEEMDQLIEQIKELRTPLAFNGHGLCRDRGTDP